ncbi:hypothetical protein GE061_009674 [Apolygus lucorum]|uniref:Lysozyme n=1 Tax=Apolygus lucorum TaxID=248454 RepID=A0A6A4KIY1_APOLU|nr:hypothetical protein GE061_009674 [Apolygus lucorum]
MNRTWIWVYVVAIAVVADAKSFEPIELAQKLHSINVSDWDIPSLVCLAHNASLLNTVHQSVVHFRATRRIITFYGIFGIPEVWLGSCGLKPKDLLDDDVDDDVKCVVEKLSDRKYSKLNRTNSLGALTPHDVDLNECFNWWEHLPRDVFSTDKSIAATQCQNSATLQTVQKTDANQHSSSQRKFHSPATISCQCDSKGVLFDISLIILDIFLVFLCGLLWASFMKWKPPRGDSVRFI